MLEHEEEILNELFDNNLSLIEKKRLYIKNILQNVNNNENLQYKTGIDDENIEKIIDEIIKIAEDTKVSVLDFKVLYNGKPIFELGNKVIKFNRDFQIPSNQHILQPDQKMIYAKGKAMTVFEKLDTSKVRDIEDVAQIMYNRLRDCGLIWLDVHRENIGLGKRNGKNDDGLRIIDADKIYDYYKLLDSMKPKMDYRYGVATKEAALMEYLQQISYLDREEEYLRQKKEKGLTENTQVKEPEIRKIYKSIIENSFYDEKYGGNAQIINGKRHGVCIDFSMELVRKLRENGFSAGVISTLNEDGYKHAAVVYVDKENGEIAIADPVTDIRQLSELSDDQRKEQLDEILEDQNWKRELRSYLKEFGKITAYNEDLSIAFDNIQDVDEIEAIPAINEDIPKKVEQIQTLSGLSNVKKVADGPTLLACQTLYKKGINTFCSNYTPNGDASINISFNSLSPENKQIIFSLIKEHPENYCVQRNTGFYGSLGRNDEYIPDEGPFELVCGIVDTSGLTTANINIKMNELVRMLKPQEYREGVYAREEILANKHNRMKARYLSGELMGLEDCKSTENDTNETIAMNENLIYSEKYNLFFDSHEHKSRYIESLARSEHDLRQEKEIAKDFGVYYDKFFGMFFESQEEFIQYYSEKMRMSKITPTDIVEADMKKKLTTRIFDNIKCFFERIKNQISNRGEK